MPNDRPGRELETRRMSFDPSYFGGIWAIRQ